MECEQFVLIGIAIVGLLAGIFAWMIWGKFKPKIEKTPYGRGSNRLFAFVKPTNVKREFFKEARINGSNAVFLDKNFKDEVPTFFARERHDYFRLTKRFVKKLFDLGLLSRRYANWLLTEMKAGYLVYLSRLDKDGVPAVEQQKWYEIFGVSGKEQYGEQWFLNQKHRNKVLADDAFVERAVEKIITDGMDEDHSDPKNVFYKKLYESLIKKQGKRGGVMFDPTEPSER